MGKGKPRAWAGANLDFVEAQPLREPDQLLCLFHASNLGTASLNDLGKGSRITHPSHPIHPSLPPWDPPLGLSDEQQVTEEQQAEGGEAGA